MKVMLLDSVQVAPEKIGEAFDWCNQNIGMSNRDDRRMPRHVSEHWTMHNGHFVFRRSTDATMFALRWA